ncbi:hypothetical protein ABW21_db0205772 [Orbilia brochopaga]|nr:hypothetical protein ABW21_db0205772 [Drechslerella brochopaga]
MSSRAPLTVPSKGSFKLNSNPTGTPQPSPAKISHPSPAHLHPSHQSGTASDLFLDQNSSPTPPPESGFPLLASRDKTLPEEQTFSTIPPAHIRQSNPQRTAQAALDLSFLSPEKTGGLSIDPALFALSLRQATKSHQDGLAQSSAVTILPDSTIDSNQDQETSSVFDLSALQSAKRKETSASPDREPFSKRLRPMNDIAAELQAPLPPPRAMLPPQGQFHTVTTPSGGVEIRHRVSLPHVQHSNNYQQSGPSQNQGSVAEIAPMAIPPNYLYIDYLKRQNQHLETQLYNRNYESNRQAHEIRRANEYAVQAKRCMRKDGHDINSLRMLILYVKNKMATWERLLKPLEVLESPSDADFNLDEQGNISGVATHIKSGIAEQVVSEVRETIKNFEKALKEVHSRPVHQLDEDIDIHTTFDG